MRTFIFFILFLFLSGTASAQEPEKVDWLRMMSSPSNRAYHKSENRTRYHALWNGNGASVSVRPLFEDEEYHKELGMTNEQFPLLHFMYSRDGSMGHWYRSKAENNPELQGQMDQWQELMRRPDDPYGEKESPEKLRQMEILNEKMSGFYFAETQKDVEKILTAEQMLKVRESELALMSEIPILNPSMFEALGLTEEQKTQMDEIKKALEPEFKQIVEELITMEDELWKTVYDTMKKNGLDYTDERTFSLENHRVFAEVATDENYKKRKEQLDTKAGNFMRQFKFKMFDVLTDEQMEKLQQIVDHPSKYVKRVLTRLGKERKKDAWKPGLDSWRPGDPIPEEYKQHREGRFPKAKAK